MNNSNHNMNTPKKIMEPLITIPKPRPQLLQQQQHQQQQQQQQSRASNNLSMRPHVPGGGTSKYAELLHVIEELGQYIRPSYAGHRGSAEKIRIGIGKARVLVKECIVETERSARQ